MPGSVHHLPPLSRARSRSSSSFEHRPLPDPVFPHTRGYAQPAAAARHQRQLEELDQLELFADTFSKAGAVAFLSHSPTSSTSSHTFSLHGHQQVTTAHRNHSPRKHQHSPSNQSSSSYQRQQRFPQKTPPSSRPGSRPGSRPTSPSRSAEAASTPSVPVPRPGSRSSRPGSRNRLVRPSNNNAPAAEGGSQPKSRIPTRPRAYSAPALDSEILTDENAPPLPNMSMTESYRLGSLANGTAGSPSHIPVLKSRIRTTSLARVPSPDLPELTDRLADVSPPFRVDLDAALAEIEDELEARANERFRKAQPAPSTPSPTLSTSPNPGARTPQGSGTKGSTTARTRTTSTRRQANGGSTGSISKANGTVTPRTPRTPNQQRTTAGVSRASSVGASPAEHTPRDRRISANGGTLNGRKRFGSDATPNSVKNCGKIPRPRTKARTSSASAVIPSPSVHPQNNTAVATPPSTVSRPGLAAHWVPPEPTFTPPKDADWDDVVLPTVAKKLGISTLSNSGHGRNQSIASALEVSQSSTSGEAGEDDLAVEWDRNGQPIRWEKQQPKAKRENIEMSPMRASMAATSEFGAMPAQSSKPPASAEMPSPAPTGYPYQPYDPGYGRSPNAQLQQPPANQIHHHFTPGEMERPRPAPVPPQQPMMPMTDSVEKPTGNTNKKNKKKRADDDVKGCACVIM
ncbi:hypothetical protein A1Q1_04441 [Trichosporon asahii var. asahii CBS 2479]|uniref:Uncharacterized protein n=1 Tax=Trichosporon asahii var. asahii (strain ATCC 90039 / CBS 2479 / JCM 2466 / KCTC 7840 / NBRC 103889/ NCYC 2677 / UAMH 7654) TaxID=1186058 RepID=J4U8L2_TRIAS|nr:hypothetical protein A1Q1_04441 [Trichosporon asahii var. asahii CBS 2479]EJT46840.1 hypothetical protein A1Q1_04441 [Trichosporon asahii var. asahii CBS 2479]